MSQDPSFPAPPPPAPPAAPPPPPPPAGGASGPRFPWEERDRLGFLDALIETVKLIVTAPGEVFARLRSDGDYLWPLVFGLIISWIGMVFSQIWSLILGSAMQSFLGNFGGFEDLAAFGATSVLQAVLLLVLWPIIYVIVVFLTAGLAHLCLMIVGAVEDSPLGFEGTFKVVAYSSVADLLNLVPLVGGLLAFFARLVLYVFGFARVHKTSEGKALGAVAILFVTCCCCLPAILGGLFAILGASLGALFSSLGNG